jgi:hypothetical protein
MILSKLNNKVQSQMIKLPKILKDHVLNDFDSGVNRKKGYNLSKDTSNLNPIIIDESKKTKVTKKGLKNTLFLR